VQARRRLSKARALVPTILAREAGSLPDCDGRLVVARAEVTSTGMAVVTVARAGGPACFVIKMPVTAEAAEALGREGSILASLHADERLGDWRELIPRPIAEGTAGRRPYRVDIALAGTAPGASVTRDTASSRWQDAAAEAIQFLHRTTAATTRVDRALAERWVDARLHHLWPRGARLRWQRSRVERLHDELHGALAGRTLRTSWVHGDFWLGNLLLSVHEGKIRGIVDWDAAAPSELALHDVLHLLLYTRRVATGAELGLIVRRHLRGASWPDQERRLLERYGAWCHDGELSERHALLLYWLRQVAAHARQQSRRDGPRYRVWELRNVHRVLDEL
jgi:aminoglycoside phosphotransferase (APT) family kinase protein